MRSLSISGSSSPSSSIKRSRNASFAVKLGSVIIFIIVIKGLHSTFSNFYHSQEVSYEKLSSIHLKDTSNLINLEGKLKQTSSSLTGSKVDENSKEEVEDDDEDDIESMEQVLKSKVTVMKLEKVIKTSKKAKSNKFKLQSTNQLLCPERGNLGCLFLLIGEISEEGSLGEQQVYQLGLLAAALGRILVLPNVGNSKFGSCQKNPFSFYYSRKVFSNFGIKSITMKQFKSWQRIQSTVSTQSVTLTSKSIARDGAFEILQGNFTLEAERLCLLDDMKDMSSFMEGGGVEVGRELEIESRGKLNFGDWSSLRFSPPPADEFYRGDAYFWSESLIQTLTSPLVTQETYLKNLTNVNGKKLNILPPSVILVSNLFNTNFLSPLLVIEFSNFELPKVFSSFPSSPTFTKITAGTIDKISPYISIYWQPNLLNSTTKVTCTQSLLTRIKSLKQLYPTLSTIYLSGSTDQFNSYEESSISALGLTITNFQIQSQNSIFSSSSSTSHQLLQQSNLDSGIKSLLEKSIATKAEIFLSSNQFCTGIDNTVTLDFINAVSMSRRDRRNNFWSEDSEEATPGKTGHPWNGVSHFGGEDDD